MSARTRIIRFVRHWHARVGVLAALLFLLLSATGMMLNHTHALKLDHHQVRAAWLTRWYGLDADQNARVWPLGKGALLTADQRWWLDGNNIAEHRPAVIGAVEHAGMRYIATSNTLALYLPDGQLVEKLDVTTLPGTPIHRLGNTRHGIVIETGAGEYIADERLEWRRHKTSGVAWSASRALRSDETKQWAAMLAPGLSLEKVILDVHSGRILGRYGDLVMDVAAVVLMLLSLSGIWIYFRSIRKRHT